MKFGLLKTWFLIGLVGMSFSNVSLAGKDCVVGICPNQVNHPDSSTHPDGHECEKGHAICKDCLTQQVHCARTPIELDDLKKQGLPCCAQEGCENHISLNQIHSILDSKDQEDLKDRLKKHEIEEESKLLEKKFQTESERFEEGIKDAFNTYCPREKCGENFGEYAVEGCYAATCTRCGGHFCYLCLESQENFKTAHDHIDQHRPGYADRYQWLLARNKLDLLFSQELSAEAKEALSSHEQKLKEKKMWPMPAGRSTQVWIHEVQQSELSLEMQIEIFQNEYIFQHSKASESSELLRATLENMNAPVLASLDRNDGMPANDNLDAFQLQNIQPQLMEIDIAPQNVQHQPAELDIATQNVWVENGRRVPRSLRRKIQPQMGERNWIVPNDNVWM